MKAKIKEEFSDSNTNHSARLEARISPELKNLFSKAAKMQGTSLTNFIIASAKKEADATFKQQTLIDLTLQDKIHLIKNCINDSSPSEELQKAAKEFLKLPNLQ
ncbi:MAG: DUF1778 domain-containing protein [Rickettsia endosymbiont of Graphium doson]|uniref:type II toxin-antitoxin system TacA family antitoxin n=1 Tax=unclassified Rickettsia TaxID=114295 RepID=UPI0031334B7E|nr:DUF1778 domain-containing protein [Rickettsia endosymbiont of Graphium doson]